MDPNQALIDLRELVEEILVGGSAAFTWKDLAESLAEAVESMDEWISRGGFLPEDWEEL